jgi:hypothetical protein
MREEELLHVATLGACTCAALAFEAVIGLMGVGVTGIPKYGPIGSGGARAHACARGGGGGGGGGRRASRGRHPHTPLWVLSGF